MQEEGDNLYELCGLLIKYFSANKEKKKKDIAWSLPGLTFTIQSTKNWFSNWQQNLYLLGRKRRGIGTEKLVERGKLITLELSKELIVSIIVCLS